jgi:hypothetical protein
MRHERGGACTALDHLAIDPEGDLAFEDEKELFLVRLHVQGRDSRRATPLLGLRSGCCGLLRLG